MEQVSPEQAKAAEAQQREGRGSGMAWMIWLFTAIVVYVLSTGPVEGLEKKGLVPAGAADAIYAPLGFLCDHIPAVQRFFVWYVERLWKAG